MMYIEGHWETVNSLRDVVKIIREYYNRELADVTEEMLDDLIDAYNDRIEELTYYNDDWNDDLYDD